MYKTFHLHQHRPRRRALGTVAAIYGGNQVSGYVRPLVRQRQQYGGAHSSIVPLIDNDILPPVKYLDNNGGMIETIHKHRPAGRRLKAEKARLKRATEEVKEVSRGLRNVTQKLKKRTTTTGSRRRGGTSKQRRRRTTTTGRRAGRARRRRRRQPQMGGRGRLLGRLPKGGRPYIDINDFYSVTRKPKRGAKRRRDLFGEYSIPVR